MSKLPDLLLFDQQLTEEELAIQKSVRDYCDKSLMPRIQKANREELFDKEIYKELADLGLLGPHIKGYGEYGVNNVYAGVPVIIGNEGVEKIEQIDLDDKEKKEFMHSIDAVKALWEAASKIDPDLR